ncbi:MAG: glycosyltransferase family 2 protein [Bacteroidetes bacterium]|nr:glycosyltransferase family 2 protein [Bacteroidota bacterium]
MKVAIVILNWNGKALLEKFLPSVITNNCSYATIYVADNASTDDSISFLKTNFPQIEIISNAVNGGFAKGYNDALRKIDADYYVLLNSDVEVTANWIESVIALMESDNQIAACQPKIKSYNNKDYFEYAGAAGGFIDKYGYPFCRGRIFNSFEKDEGQYNDVKEIMWATGACLFIRADIYKKVGGLDEDFFAHMEEIDLCWRIKNLGWKIMYCPYSTVYHLGGGTLSKINHHKTYLNFRNNLYLLCKNHSSEYFRIKLFLRFILDGIAAIKFLGSLEFDHFWAVFRAHMSFYANFSSVLRKRNELKKQIKTYSTSAIYRESLIKAYFFRGVRKFSELKQDLFY